jgi:hypothetical protein
VKRIAGIALMTLAAGAAFAFTAAPAYADGHGYCGYHGWEHENKGSMHHDGYCGYHGWDDEKGAEHHGWDGYYHH